ncbi:enoyl-CoA hydratase/isomerase family protein [Phyllobacterium zundukense]|uniref:3-hydroxyisobutyryl-CoA hydrolase n=1 Tax=Phyllobacterium zundukense TaxID=1867719 RepID=A0A2N9W3X7_9HYPH|nr:enoyl-CoA hydratase/isomerase family protein [Phyllobacterium zundukense]ATU92081.1 3-hydroxyisobutyryl-CoA hydrolase [Phyllobacterium zundukense]PIO46445.1 3-hydroxyisobutyryl-CoA hydrolase [Phyllobacterium zundukense]
MEIDFGGQGEIVFERRGKAGLVRLTRPKALNALTRTMVNAFHRALIAWSTDPDVHCVIVEGEGRAFCAGGDILAVYHAGRSGQPLYEFFADEYRLNAFIRHFPKPYISLIDGIVMGGGVGISVHGSHRVVTENVMFAMPEVGIGFFPDVGGSAFLPHLPEHFGTYLALTGTRVRQGDCLQSGIATHAIKAEDKERVRRSLIRTGNPDIALRGKTINPDYETPEKTRDMIGVLFDSQTLGGCLIRLAAAGVNGNDWAQQILDLIKTRSPTSLHVTFRQIEEGRDLEMDQCMQMEYRILSRMLENHDFYEGVRALLVDKDNTPVWQPANIDDVTPEMVDAYFAPLGERELQLT